jgi:hypothetical protein
MKAVKFHFWTFSKFHVTCVLYLTVFLAFDLYRQSVKIDSVIKNRNYGNDWKILASVVSQRFQRKHSLKRRTFLCQEQS